MASIGGAAASGLESGFRMAESFYDRQDRKKLQQDELDLRRDEHQTRHARQKVLDQRTDADYAENVASGIHKDTVSEFAATTAKYGGWETTPPEVQARLQKRADEAAAAVGAAKTRRNELAFGKKSQELDDVISNLTAGRVRPEDVPPAQLYQAISNATKRDPRDFLTGADGSPPPVAKAVGDITTGLETGNEGMLLSGANTLFSPELRKGVGLASPHGGKIIGKEIIKMIPHPDNPDLVSPVIRVYVDKGKEFTGARDGRGATGYYDAPITENRSTDPEDNVKFISMKNAFDRIGQMGVLSEMLNHPEVRSQLEKGETEAGTAAKEHLDTYFTLGQAAAPKKVEATQNIPLPANGGSTLRVTTDAQGRELRRETIKHDEKKFRNGVVQTKLDAIEAGVADGTFSEQEGAVMTKALVSGIKPAGSNGANAPTPPGTSKSGSGGKPVKITESEVKGTLADAAKSIAAKNGLKMDQLAKRWVNISDGKAASPETVNKVNQEYEATARRVRDNAAAGKKTGLTEALEGTSAPGSKGPKVVKWGDLK